jgi:tape measure domain-containing protein
MATLDSLTVEFNLQINDISRQIAEVKKQIEQSKVEISLTFNQKSINKLNQIKLTPKVDLKPLHDLNKLLDVKLAHYKKVQKYFNDNPLIVKSGNVTQQSTKRSASNSNLIDFKSKDLRESITDSIVAGIKESEKTGVFEKAGSLIASPFKMAGKAVSGLLFGATIAIGSLLVNNIDKITKTVGDFQSVFKGEPIAKDSGFEQQKEDVDALKKEIDNFKDSVRNASNFFEDLSHNLKKEETVPQSKSIISEKNNTKKQNTDDLVTPVKSLQKARQVNFKIFKKAQQVIVDNFNQSIENEIKVTQKDVTSALRSSLKRTTKGNVIININQVLDTIDYIQEQLEEATKLINDKEIKGTTRRRLGAFKGTLTNQKKMAEKALDAIRLRFPVEVEKREKVGIERSSVSQEILKGLQQTQSFPDLKLARFTDPNDIEKQANEVLSSGTDVSNIKITFEEAKQIVEDVYGKIIEQAKEASGIKENIEVPSLNFESLGGMSGQFNPQFNSITVGIENMMKSLNENVEDELNDVIITILHEARHAIQSDFGKRGYETEGLPIVSFSDIEKDIQNDVMKRVISSVKSAKQRIDELPIPEEDKKKLLTQAKNAELDAYTFEATEGKKISQNLRPEIQAKIALARARKYVSQAGEKAKQTLGNQATTSKKQANIPVGNILKEMGEIDETTTESFKSIGKQILKNIGKGLTEDQGLLIKEMTEITDDLKQQIIIASENTQLPVNLTSFEKVEKQIQKITDIVSVQTNDSIKQVSLAGELLETYQLIEKELENQETATGLISLAVGERLGSEFKELIQIKNAIEEMSSGDILNIDTTEIVEQLKPVLSKINEIIEKEIPSSVAELPEKYNKRAEKVRRIGDAIPIQLQNLPNEDTIKTQKSNVQSLENELEQTLRADEKNKKVAAKKRKQAEETEDIEKKKKLLTSAESLEQRYDIAKSSYEARKKESEIPLEEQRLDALKVLLSNYEGVVELTQNLLSVNPKNSEEARRKILLGEVNKQKDLRKERKEKESRAVVPFSSGVSTETEEKRQQDLKKINEERLKALKEQKKQQDLLEKQENARKNASKIRRGIRGIEVKDFGAGGKEYQEIQKLLNNIKVNLDIDVDETQLDNIKTVIASVLKTQIDLTGLTPNSQLGVKSGENTGLDRETLTLNLSSELIDNLKSMNLSENILNSLNIEIRKFFQSTTPVDFKSVQKKAETLSKEQSIDILEKIAILQKDYIAKLSISTDKQIREALSIAENAIKEVRSTKISELDKVRKSKINALIKAQVNSGGKISNRELQIKKNLVDAQYEAQVAAIQRTGVSDEQKDKKIESIKQITQKRILDIKSKAIKQRNIITGLNKDAFQFYEVNKNELLLQTIATIKSVTKFEQANLASYKIKSNIPNLRIKSNSKNAQKAIDLIEQINNSVRGNDIPLLVKNSEKINDLLAKVALSLADAEEIKSKNLTVLSNAMKRKKQVELLKKGIDKNKLIQLRTGKQLLTIKSEIAKRKTELESMKEKDNGQFDPLSSGLAKLGNEKISEKDNEKINQLTSELERLEKQSKSLSSRLSKQDEGKSKLETTLGNINSVKLENTKQLYLTIKQKKEETDQLITDLESKGIEKGQEPNYQSLLQKQKMLTQMFSESKSKLDEISKVVESEQLEVSTAINALETISNKRKQLQSVLKVAEVSKQKLNTKIEEVKANQKKQLKIKSIGDQYGNILKIIKTLDTEKTDKQTRNILRIAMGQLQTIGINTSLVLKNSKSGKDFNKNILLLYQNLADADVKSVEDFGLSIAERRKQAVVLLASSSKVTLAQKANNPKELEDAYTQLFKEIKASGVSIPDEIKKITDPTILSNKLIELAIERANQIKTETLQSVYKPSSNGNLILKESNRVYSSIKTVNQLRGKVIIDQLRKYNPYQIVTTEIFSSLKQIGKISEEIARKEKQSKGKPINLFSEKQALKGQRDKLIKILKKSGIDTLQLSKVLENKPINQQIDILVKNYFSTEQQISKLANITKKKVSDLSSIAEDLVVAGDLSDEQNALLERTLIKLRKQMGDLGINSPDKIIEAILVNSNTIDGLSTAGDKFTKLPDLLKKIFPDLEKSGLFLEFESAVKKFPDQAEANFNEFVNKIENPALRGAVKNAVGVLFKEFEIPNVKGVLNKEFLKQRLDQVGNIIKSSFKGFDNILELFGTSSEQIFDKFKSLGSKGLKAFLGIGIGLGAFKLASHAVTQGLQFLGNQIQQIASETLTSSVAFEKFNTTLTLTTGSATLAKKSLSDISTVASELGISIQATQEQYSKFASATQGTALVKDTDKIFEGFSTASAALNLSEEEVKGVFLALTQISAKGKITSEEFRQQLSERLPIASQVASEALGVTQKQFTSMLDSGKLKLTDLTLIADKLSTKFADVKNIQTASKAFQSLKNEIYLGQLAIGNLLLPVIKLFANVSLNVISSIKQGISTVSNSIKLTVGLFGLIAKPFMEIQKEINKAKDFSDKLFLSIISPVNGIYTALTSILSPMVKIGIQALAVGGFLNLVTLSFTGIKALSTFLFPFIDSGLKMIGIDLYVIETQINTGLLTGLKAVGLAMAKFFLIFTAFEVAIKGIQSLINSYRGFQSVIDETTTTFELANKEATNFRNTLLNIQNIRNIDLGLTINGKNIDTALEDAREKLTKLTPNEKIFGVLPSFTQFVNGVGSIFGTTEEGVKTDPLYKGSAEERVSVQFFEKAMDQSRKYEDSINDLSVARIKLSKSTAMADTNDNQTVIDALDAEIKAKSQGISLLEQAKEAALTGQIAAENAGNEVDAKSYAESAVNIQAQIDARTESNKKLMSERALRDLVVISLDEQNQAMERELALLDARKQLAEANLDIDVLSGKKTQSQADQDKLKLTQQRLQDEIKLEEETQVKVSQMKQRAYEAVSNLTKIPIGQLTDRKILEFLPTTTDIEQGTKDIYTTAINQSVTGQNKLLQLSKDSEKTNLEIIKAGVDARLYNINLEFEKRNAINENKFSENKLLIEKEAIAEKKLESRKQAELLIEEKINNQRIVNAKIKKLREIESVLKKEKTLTIEQRKDLKNQILTLENEINDVKANILKSTSDIAQNLISQIEEGITTATEHSVSFFRNENQIIASQLAKGLITQEQASQQLLTIKANEQDHLIALDQYRVSELEKLQETVGLTADQEKELVKARQKLGETKVNAPVKLLGDMEQQTTELNQIVENGAKLTEKNINELVANGTISRKEADKQIAESNLSMNRQKLTNDENYLARLIEFNKANPTIEGNTKILAKEKEINDSRIALIQQEEQAQQARYDAVIYANEQANKTIEKSTKEREISIQQLKNKGLISAKEADRTLASSTQKLNKDKLAQEQQTLKRLTALYQQHPTIESLVIIKDKTKEVADLTLQTLQDEYEAQTRLVELAKEKIDYENKSLDINQQSLSLIEKGLDNQSKLIESRSNLVKALSDLELGRTQQQINELQAQVELVNGEQAKLDLKKQIYELETKSTQQKLKALLNEQRQQLMSLQLEERRNKLASQRNELDAKKAVNDAQIALLEAERGGDERDINLAKESLSIALQGQLLAKEQTITNDELSKNSMTALLANQQLAKEQFASDESLRLSALQRDLNKPPEGTNQPTDQPTDQPTGITTEGVTATVKPDIKVQSEIEKDILKQFNRPILDGNNFKMLATRQVQDIAQTALNGLSNMTADILNPVIDQLKVIGNKLSAIENQRPVVNQNNIFENKFADTDQSKLLARVRSQTYDQISSVMSSV